MALEEVIRDKKVVIVLKADGSMERSYVTRESGVMDGDSWKYQPEVKDIEVDGDFIANIIGSASVVTAEHVETERNAKSDVQRELAAEKKAHERTAERAQRELDAEKKAHERTAERIRRLEARLSQIAASAAAAVD